MVRVYHESEHYVEQLRKRVENALKAPIEERMLFVVVEQVGEGYSPRRIELQGPWPADQFDFDWLPGQIRGPLGEIDEELIVGFFEVNPEAVGVEEGLAYTQQWPLPPERIMPVQ